MAQHPERDPNYAYDFERAAREAHDRRVAPTLEEVRERITSRRPRATGVLLVVTSLLFGAQMLLGADSDPAVDVLLGGLVRERVLAGEWWRLVAYGFLHANPVHFAFNMYALWSLGRALEPLVGTPRFVVLYGASIVGAGLVALATSQASVTVGASGGLFGLFGAEFVLLRSRPRLLPFEGRAARLRSALQMLVANTLFSFLPNVALGAHAGGALTGLALAAVGAVPHDDADVRTPSVAWWVAAGLVTAGLALGLVAALAGPVVALSR